MPYPERTTVELLSRYASPNRGATFGCPVVNSPRIAAGSGKERAAGDPELVGRKLRDRAPGVVRLDLRFNRIGHAERKPVKGRS